MEDGGSRDFQGGGGRALNTAVYDMFTGTRLSGQASRTSAPAEALAELKAAFRVLGARIESAEGKIARSEVAR